MRRRFEQSYNARAPDEELRPLFSAEFARAARTSSKDLDEDSFKATPPSKATELQSYQVTKLPSYNVTKLQSYDEDSFNTSPPSKAKDKPGSPDA